GEIGTMRLGATSMALGFLLMPVASAPLLFLMVATLIPVGTALLYPTSTSLLTQRAPENEVGQILGVQQSFRGMAGILGPAGAGIAYDYLSHMSPMVLSGALMGLVTL
ncbi:MAG: MFS transporter, partial [Acidobacteria bacterium]|nr:MFS transporter [Acidobacteriota bacterium]